jgi:hypothetical protein
MLVQSWELGRAIEDLSLISLPNRVYSTYPSRQNNGLAFL